jgi:glycine cleavage system H protein
MDIPDNLQYTKDHEWIRVENDLGTVGITDYAQGELGDVIYLELPKKGFITKQGEPFGTVEAVKTVADLIAPLSGTVVAVNDSLNDSPELVNTSPYEKGWMIQIRLSDMEELKSLLSSGEYKDLVT